MPPPSQPCLKRPRSPISDDEDGSELHGVLTSVDSSYLTSHTYGASRFGEFGEYMSRKRAKLQIQNADIDAEGDASSRIFNGLQIYINGWTEPSVQDLRQLIIQHGGIFHAYLDKKSLVTHIITCSLTPAKVREFKHMKIVRPEWLVDSVKAGILLPWHDFVFRPGERTEDSQGRKAAQKSLFDGFMSQESRQRGADHADQSVGHGKSTRPGAEDPDPPEREPAIRVVSKLLKNRPQPPRTPRKPTHSSPVRRSTPLIREPSQADAFPGSRAYVESPRERAMADPAWRAAHTSVAPDFIEGYYRNSRLHHLSTWKAELRNLVAEAQERVENGGAAVWGRMAGGDPRREGEEEEEAGDADADAERVIMHCDFDSFFVSAGLIDRPHLRGKPVVVCHSQGTTGGGASTSEIASASYEARNLASRQARKLCPTVMTIPYEFQRYKQFSLQFYTILMAHADDLQAVSVDEALSTSQAVSTGSKQRYLEARIQNPLLGPCKGVRRGDRAQVKKVTGCEVSIGIAHNIMLARVASRRAKPAGSFHILPADVADVLAPLDIDDLHGFGYSTRQKAQEKLGETNLGHLAKKSKAVLCDALGKGTGETLYKAVRGIDDHQLESDKPRKSVSCDINYGIRFENNTQAETFVYQMAEEVAKRLDDIDMRGRSLTLKIMKRDPSAPVEAPKFLGHGICETFSKQTPLIAPGGRATSDALVIGEHAWRLLKNFNFDPKELRGVSIQIQKLKKAVLPFKPVDGVKHVHHAENAALANSKHADEPHIHVEPPSQDDDEIQIISPPNRKSEQPTFDLPSFSQVDMSVFDALPDDVRKELENEYKRRSVTPAVTGEPSRDRSISVPAERKPKSILVKGTNVKRITQQLAPRSKSSISPKKSVLFAKRDRPFAVDVSDRELRRLDVDPDVFAVLPADLQREQLAMARQVKNPGAEVYTKRKVLKPSSRRPGSPSVYHRPPAPKANYQQGKAKGEKLYFSETDDVQQVIEAWVDGFKERPPNQKDVEFFSKFWCSKAVAVAKWWLVLLRRYFGVWENAPDTDDSQAVAENSSERVGRAWWRAFRERFGGCLSLR
ncbi:DNA repair protein [Amylocystis lapponica]|nr:DNA repair protein [Amylocystis lapponica]